MALEQLNFIGKDVLEKQPEPLQKLFEHVELILEQDGGVDVRGLFNSGGRLYCDTLDTAIDASKLDDGEKSQLHAVIEPLREYLLGETVAFREFGSARTREEKIEVVRKWKGVLKDVHSKQLSDLFRQLGWDVPKEGLTIPLSRGYGERLLKAKISLSEL